MKVKQLIKELQKFDPNVDVFLNGLMELRHIDHLRKIKVFKDKKSIFIEGSKGDWMKRQYDGKFVKFDRYNEAAMNTKNPQAVIIDQFLDYKKIRKERRKNAVSNK